MTLEHRLSENLRDGVMALGPSSVGLTVGAVGGGLLLLLARPLWFFGRCVFSDAAALQTINPDAPIGECLAVPAMPWYQWLAAVAALVALGMAYSVVHRMVLWQRLERRVLGFNVYVSDLFAALMGFLLATLWAQHVPRNWLWPFAFTELVIGLAVVVLPLWWRLITLLGVGVYAYTAPEDPTIAATVHVMLARQFQIPSLEKVQVRCEGERLEVTGPFDAVDKKRIDDLLAVRYPVTFQVQLNSTLADGVYWRPYTHDLAPSGYKSKPLRETRVSGALVYGLVAIGALVIAVAVVQRPSLFLGAADIRGFAQQAQDWQNSAPQPVVFRGGRTSRFHEPFFIDMRASQEACPAFAVETTDRWRLANENRVVRSKSEPAVRIHAVDELYYLFFIDRKTRSCQKQFDFPTLEMARTAAAYYVRRTTWQLISDREEWRNVPADAR